MSWLYRFLAAKHFNAIFTITEAVICGLMFVLTAELWWYFGEVPGEGKEAPPILPSRASLAFFFFPHNSFLPMWVLSKMAQFSWISWAVCLSDQTLALSLIVTVSRVCETDTEFFSESAEPCPSVLIIATFPEKRKKKTSHRFCLLRWKQILFLRFLFILQQVFLKGKGRLKNVTGLNMRLTTLCDDSFHPICLNVWMEFKAPPPF